MEKSSKRGKIPQSDWPLIMARYEAGETLASIARTYDCSPPAISYVVSRSRARVPGTDASAKPPSASEPQLIKGGASEAPAPAFARPQEAGAVVGNGHAAPAGTGAGRLDGEAQPGTAAADTSERRDRNPPRDGNGFAQNGGGNGAGDRDAQPSGVAPSPTPRPAGPPQRPLVTPPPHTNGPDQRRTLHLSLGGAAPGNGGQQPADPASSGRANLPGRGQPPQPDLAAAYRDRDAAASPDFSNIRPAFNEPVRRTDADTAPPRKDGGSSFIDQELRARVDGDIAAFLAAFDAALVEDTRESRSALREATDRLLRAGARTSIELERLEARIPLPARDNGGSGEPAWRHR